MHTQTGPALALPIPGAAGRGWGSAMLSSPPTTGGPGKPAGSWAPHSLSPFPRPPSPPTARDPHRPEQPSPWSYQGSGGSTPEMCLVISDAPRQLGEGALWLPDLQGKGNLYKMSISWVPRELICSNYSVRQDGSPHVSEEEPEVQRSPWPRTHSWNDEAGTGPQCCVTPDPGGWNGRGSVEVGAGLLCRARNRLWLPGGRGCTTQSCPQASAIGSKFQIGYQQHAK